MRSRQWRAFGAYRAPVRCDNGRELLAELFVNRRRVKRIETRYIQPGKPNQDAFVERFNRTYRTDVLDAHLFESLDEVRLINESWIREYIEERLQEATGRIPPSVFRRQIEAKVSTLGWSG